MIELRSNTLNIAILYPGEMGVSFGEHLIRTGFHVLTTCQDRSKETQERCERSMLQKVSGLETLIDVSDVIISLVPPKAAESVASAFINLFDQSRQKPLVYIDANAISPITSKKIGIIIENPQITYCDASIYGLSKNIGSTGKLFLSGNNAHKIYDLFRETIDTVVVSNNIGDASAIKMLIGGINKELVAQFLELSRAAERLGLLDTFLHEGRIIYPALFEILDRLLPTYPKHSNRRVEEMNELAATIKSIGEKPRFATAAGKTFSELLGDNFKKQWREAEDVKKSIRHILEGISRTAN